MKKNAYTQTWFDLFGATRPFTQSENGFITRNLPRPPFESILDVCCGLGRHTNLLAQQGYKMVGVDLDEKALVIAQKNAPSNVKYIQEDMRNLAEVEGEFDAVILMWQSYGYFDAETNESILEQISQKLTKGGRFILDIYNRAFWEKNQGIKKFSRNGIEIEACNTMHGNRLVCELDYGDSFESESFDWQLYYFDEIVELAERHQLKLLVSGVESDENRLVSDKNQQMQLVFEKA